LEKPVFTKPIAVKKRLGMGASTIAKGMLGSSQSKSFGLEFKPFLHEPQWQLKILKAPKRSFGAKRSFGGPQRSLVDVKIFFNWDPIVTLQNLKDLLGTFIHPIKTPWGLERTPCDPTRRKCNPTCILHRAPFCQDSVLKKPILAKKGKAWGALKKHHATGQGEDATQYAYCTSPLLPELGFYKTDADQKGQGMGAPNKPHAAR